MKVLIVDDEPPIVEMYKEKLVHEKFTVITANDGEEALAKAQSEQPDLILLDIIMPKFNGLDVLQTLKADSRTEGIPVFLLTNIPKDPNIQKGRELGADRYLFKAETEPGTLAKVLKEFEAGLAKQ